MAKRNLIIWSKHRWNIQKWILRILRSLAKEKLRNLLEGGLKTWLM